MSEPYGKGNRVTALNVGGGKQARPAEAEERALHVGRSYSKGMVLDALDSTVGST